MKSKVITLLLCVTMATSFAACGKSAADSTGTETMLSEAASTETASTETGVDSASIKYNVNDYVKLGDYNNVEVTLNSSDYTVTDDSVNSYADSLIKYYKPYAADASKTVVGENDIVDVDYVGTLDGKEFDGGSAKGALIDVAKNADAKQGTGFIEGFSKGLVGAKVGDKVSTEVTFPADYSAENLKGKTVTFTFTVNSVDYAMTRDNIDDAYVKENFQSDTVADFMSQVKTYLENQAASKKQSDLMNAVIEAVEKTSTCDKYPDGLLDARIAEYVANFKKQNTNDTTTLEDYLKNTYNMTVDDFNKQVSTMVEKSLKQELIFEAIADKEKIEVDADGYKTYIANIQSNGSFASEDAVYKNYGKTAESGKAYMERMYRIQKAAQKVADAAKVTYTEGTETPATEAAATEAATTEASVTEAK